VAPHCGHFFSMPGSASASFIHVSQKQSCQNVTQNCVSFTDRKRMPFGAGTRFTRNGTEKQKGKPSRVALRKHHQPIKTVGPAAVEFATLRELSVQSPLGPRKRKQRPECHCFRLARAGFSGNDQFLDEHRGRLTPESRRSLKIGRGD
jgi:hypothetical protein